MVKSKVDDRVSSDTIWYQSILNRYNSAQAANNGIDTKSSVVLAGSLAVAIFGAGVNNVNALHLLGIVILIISVIYTVKSIHLRDVNTEVHTTKEKEKYYGLSNEIFIWKLIADLEASLEKAEGTNADKARHYKWIVYLFVVGSILILLGQIVETSNPRKEQNYGREHTKTTETKGRYYKHDTSR